MIYILLGIVLGIVISILEIKFNFNKDSIWCGFIIGIIVCLIIISKETNKQQNYIQNIETKLNIYEQSYDEFALEDSLSQSDVYE